MSLPADKIHMTEPEIQTVQFDSRLTIAETPDWYIRLLTLLLDSEALNIDLHAVIRIDTAGLQLLCCFAREAARLQVRLNWQPLPESVQQALDLAGLELAGIETAIRE